MWERNERNNIKIMRKPFTDRWELNCRNCGHRWIILTVNGILSRKQLSDWALSVKWEHFLIRIQTLFGKN